MTTKKKTATARPVAVPTPAPEPPSFHILHPCRDSGDELNPGIVDELEPAQSESLRTAAYRLDEYPAETVRRLVGLALFLVGIDPASEDEAIDVLEKILGEDDEATEAVNQFRAAADAARALSLTRERLDRNEFVRLRQAEIKRLPTGMEAYVARHAAAGA
jgi:hypothetical protein